MKRYLNTADYIVFGFSFISLFWIICYKFIWSLDSLSLLFNDADIVADIFYTVFTSVIASGLFYLFTSFIPKVPQIFKMDKIVKTKIPDIDRLSKLIIGQITSTKSGIVYSFDEYMKGVVEQSQNIDNDFAVFYSSLPDKSIFHKTIKYQSTYIISIISDFSSLLPSKVLLQLTDLINQTTNVEELLPIENNRATYDRYSHKFKLMLLCNYMLKEHFDYKNEAI